jgi:NDP-sugar pyrophosphorylase family protein
MKPISYVICAAGQGFRFREKGINIPKPLMLLKGKTMLERSIESLPLRPLDQLIIISQKADSLPSLFPTLHKCEWLEIEATTKGQLNTFLLAKDMILFDDIVIYNCDTFFHSPGLLELMESDLYSGIIPCSPQPGDCWSFCEVDSQLHILKVAEKERISDWASVGFYYFKGKKLLLELAELECLETQGKESYVAPLYNRYLALGHKLSVAEVDRFLPFGTIEQVKTYWDVSIEELKRQNP